MKQKHKLPRYEGPSLCSKKKDYSNKMEALIAASLALRTVDQVTLRAYLCPICSKWHLTTQEFDPAKSAAHKN